MARNEPNSTPRSSDKRAIFSGKRVSTIGEPGHPGRRPEVGIEVGQEVFREEVVYAVVNDWLVSAIVESIIKEQTNLALGGGT
jgi:hypothetical protein